MTAMAEPIFIGGCGRSGTTLFVDLLGCHPDIAPIYEPWFICNVAELIFLRRDLPAGRRDEMIGSGVADWVAKLDARPHDKRAEERYRHGAHCIRFGRDLALAETDRLCRRLRDEPPLTAYRDYLETLFNAHAAAMGKPRWAAKVPRFVRMLPLLVQLFPDLRFVNLVRDPRRVVPSLVSRQWGPKSVDEAIAYWRNDIEAARRFAAARPNQIFDVPYETLVSNPAAALSAALCWLGIDDTADAIVADYARDPGFHPERALAPAQDGAGELAAVTRSLGALMKAYRYA
jgi:hypothetical protein